MVLSYFILSKRSSTFLVLSMVPICLGVMLTVSGDLDLTFIGYRRLFAPREQPLLNVEIGGGG
jgi:hypothetical protein